MPTTISAIPLIAAILLTLIAYLGVSIKSVTEDIEEALIDVRLYNDRWLLKEYGIVGLLVIRVIQACSEVRYAVQKI